MMHTLVSYKYSRARRTLLGRVWGIALVVSVGQVRGGRRRGRG